MSKELTPQEAYPLAEAKLRDGERFSGTCVDYHNSWWFPTLMDNGVLGTYIFVLKNSGDAFYFDPAFSAREFSQAPNVTEQVPELQSLAHHGVKGMKWGVRRERNAARRKAYSKELANPGSQSSKALTTKYIRQKKTQNNVARILLGREAAIGSLATTLAGVQVGSAVAAAAAEYGAAATAAAFAGPIGLTAGLGGVTVAAGAGAYRAHKRYKALQESSDIRDLREYDKT